MKNVLISYEFLPKHLTSTPYLEEEDEEKEINLSPEPCEPNPNYSPIWLKYDHSPYRL